MNVLKMVCLRTGQFFAIEAFNANPSPSSMLEIMVNADSYSELKPDVENFCKSFVSSFEKNKTEWSKQDGFRLKVEAARLGAVYSARVSQGDRDLADFYASIQRECLNELRRIGEEKRW